MEVVQEVKDVHAIMTIGEYMQSMKNNLSDLNKMFAWDSKKGIPLNAIFKSARLRNAILNLANGQPNKTISLTVKGGEIVSVRGSEGGDVRNFMKDYFNLYGVCLKANVDNALVYIDHNKKQVRLLNDALSI